jgi:hypothetical protein
MRLVTEEQERVVYDTVYSYLSSTPDVCPFLVRRQDLRTITGEDEGYFGALSANYLSGVIDKDRQLLHPDHASSVLGALDLGGSSTQVSLLTSNGDASIDPVDFFVHSYLGYGVEKMAERFSTYAVEKQLAADPCTPSGYRSPTGLTGSGDFTECQAALATALGLDCQPSGRCVMDGVALPSVEPDAKFLAMSVYFFALRSLYLVLSKVSSPVMSWPSPSLDELSAAAQEYCAMPWADIETLAKVDGWENFMGGEPLALATIGLNIA